jgi:hypothetical protein
MNWTQHELDTNGQAQNRLDTKWKGSLRQTPGAPLVQIPPFRTTFEVQRGVTIKVAKDHSIE